MVKSLSSEQSTVIVSVDGMSGRRMKYQWNIPSAWLAAAAAATFTAFGSCVDGFS